MLSTAAPRFDAETALSIRGVVTLKGDQCGNDGASSILFSSTCSPTTCPTKEGDCQAHSEVSQAPEDTTAQEDTTNTIPIEIEHPETHPEATGGEVGNAFAKWARVAVNAAALGMSCHACWGAIADRGIDSPVSRETCATFYYMVAGTRFQKDPVNIELKPPETLSEYLIVQGICAQCVQGIRPACAPCAAAFVAATSQRNK
jgi:hypothetical protein